MTNASGIAPTEFKVLILPKEVEEKIGSIIMPESKKDADKFATTEGTLIASSPLAFTYATEAEWEAVGAVPPQAGQRIVFAKYAGVRIKGSDGKEYVLANDKDVLATIA